MATPVPAVIIRNGKEKPLHELARGDQIAFREWDGDRKTYVFWVVTPGVPASGEVEAADVWDCERRGHYWMRGGACLKCQEPYEPPTIGDL